MKKRISNKMVSEWMDEWIESRTPEPEYYTPSDIVDMAYNDFIYENNIKKISKLDRKRVKNIIRKKWKEYVSDLYDYY